MTAVLGMCGALAALAGCDFGAPGGQAAPRYACFQVADPYSGAGKWYRANFHLHSSHSDGGMSGSQLVDLYRQHGYSVLCISDHNQYGDQDGGVAVSQQVDSLVHDWNGDGIVHPTHVFGSGTEAYVRDWNQPSFAWVRDGWQRRNTSDWMESPFVIPGAEASLDGNHIGLIGHPGGRIESPGEPPGYLHRVRDAGGFIYLAHPGDWNAVPYNLTRVLDLRFFNGLEIVNGLRLTQAFAGAGAGAGTSAGTSTGTGAKAGAAAGDHDHDRECGAGLAWDATPVWDAMLAQGRRLWGLANDDAHTGEDAPEAYPFSAFNMIYTSDPTAEGFLRALHHGALYGSNGLLFSQLGVLEGTVTVVAPDAEQVRFIGWGGQVLQESAGPQASYRPQGHEGYVRVEATGAPQGRPWPRQAWSQPFWIQPAACKPDTTG